MTIHISADDNSTKPAVKAVIGKLASAYEELSVLDLDSGLQVLANKIYDLMHELEDVGFEQEEGSDDMSTAMPVVL